MGQWNWMDKLKEKMKLYSDRNIAVYGTGVNAERVVDALSSFSVVGLMDGRLTDGYKWNLKILSEQEAIELKVGVIIIAARPCVLEEIYNRIFNFCQRNQIILLHMYGENVRDIFAEVTRQNSNFFRLSESGLYKSILRHKKVSFDIFDTLLMRKISEPSDLFEVVERRAGKSGIYIQGYQEKRIHAEFIITQTSDNGSPDIDEIYKKMGELYQLDKDILEAVKIIELQIFKEVLIPRVEMIELYQKVKVAEIPIYLVSDIYVPRGILEKILSSYGIEGYKELFLSCEYKTAKGSRLFQIYLENSAAGSAIHIGDNRVADGILPGIFGIYGYVIKKASDMLKASIVTEKISAENLNSTERIIMARYLAAVFGNPFAMSGKMGKQYIDTYQKAAEAFLGPLVSVFMIWLCNAVKEENIDGILFSGRDGFLIKKMYDFVRKSYRPDLPVSYYFETSRNACIGAGIKSEEEVLGIAGIEYDGTVEEMLQNRFGLREEECLAPIEGESFEDYVMRHIQFINRHSEEMGKGYRRYAQKLGLKNNGNYLFYDFVSSGTCQYYLEKIMPFSMKGIYFCRIHVPEELNTYTRSSNKNSLVIDSMFFTGAEAESDQYFFKNYLFAELIMTSSSPSLKSINLQGEPIYYREKRTEEEKVMIECMQNAVFSFFTSIAEICDFGIIPDRKLAMDLYRLRERDYSEWDVKELESYLFLDDFGQINVPLKVN